MKKNPARSGLALIVLVFVFMASVSVCRAETVIRIPARKHAAKSGSVVPVEGQWDGLVVCHGENGMQQWDFNVKAAGEYYVHFRYASGEERPVDLFINDARQKGAFLSRNTGGFFARDLQWDTYGPFELSEGKNSLRINARGNSPHLAGLVISDRKKGLDKATFADLFGKSKERPSPLAPLNISEDTAATRAKLRRLLPGVEEILFVRRYTMQSSHYYTEFIDGCRNFGGNLGVLSLADGTIREIASKLSHGIFGRCALSFDGRKVVFGWKEKLGVGFRIWEVGIDGKGLRQLTFAPADEAARIEKYHLKDWMKSTGYSHHTDDMHPCYLPDGGICFVSTRCEYGILCDGPDKLTTSVLYRMDADGKNMEKLSNNSVSESAPTVMNDGRILYTRWEYVDNGSVTNKGLWAVRPDGTGSEEVYGMSIAFPSVFNVGRAVPGSNTLFVSIGAPHMPLGVGTLMLVDTRLDRRTGDCVTYITSEVDTQHQWGWDNVPGGATKPIPPEMQRGRDGRGNTDRGPLYMDPYPLSASQFLVAFNPRDKWNVVNAYGLYLIDGKGNRDLLAKDTEYSYWMPIPVRKRPKPPVVTGGFDKELADKGLARVVVTDIYRGMDNVPRGTIKYIRVNEHVSRPWASRRFWGGDVYDQQHSVITCNTHLGLKIQHGIVPVEEDGSAHFLVQADKNIFFQALDKDYVEVQRERTFVNFRPGEVRSCIGCHEQAQDASSAAVAKPIVSALKRSPDTPGPQPGEKRGSRPLAYEVDVQPVWDAHCVRCHGGDKTEGDLDLTGELTKLFNRSYENIIKRKFISIIGENHPKAGNNHYLPPYSLGTYASQLAKYIAPEHYDVKLTPEERIRVTTWIDSNGQYYGSYYGRKNLQYKDHPNFRPILTFEQSHANTPPILDEALR
ncbi:MAG: hypothetical protein J7M40_05725 [Planctomycetes bacterium]|nr:hypothetical protein [Planctomycetota bacterium]